MCHPSGTGDCGHSPKGKPEFAVIPYAQFLALQEELEDAACLRILRKAKAAEGAAKGVSLKDL
jgi:hypothetical protein